jgi:hypothetical protein
LGSGALAADGCFNTALELLSWSKAATKAAKPWAADVLHELVDKKQAQCFFLFFLFLHLLLFVNKFVQHVSFAAPAAAPQVSVFVLLY